jgi:dihydrofolate reductase
MEIIVALTENFVIGSDGDMPWHLPADLEHFKKITTGNTIVMGRRTWESIGHPLLDRLNIVLTRQKEYVADGATVIHSLDEIGTIETVGTVFIIGGGELYKSTLDVVDKLHVTRIHTTIEGDTFFPQIDESHWVQEQSTQFLRDEMNPFDLTFETWGKG